MKLTKSLMSVAIATVIAVPGIASAGTINPGGAGVILPTMPDTYFTTGTLYEGQVTASPATDYMSPITATGQELGGIGYIGTIAPGGGSPVWVTGQNGVQLGLQFGGYIAQRIQITSGTSATVWFSGGWANYFTAPVGTFNANGSVAPATAFASAGGTPWLNTVATTEYNCVSADGCAGGAGTGITLIANIIGTPTHILPGSSGLGYLSVGPGAGVANGNFDTNTYLTPSGSIADTFLNSSFQNPIPGSTQFAANGSFNLAGVAIPAPGSLFLLGIGALAMGFGLSRKSKSAYFA